jgi:hypothetical protein
MKTKDVIEDVELAIRPERVVELLTGSELPSWRCKQSEVTFRFDIVGEHVIAKLRVVAVTPAFLALAVASTSSDVGWAGTRVHVAVARTSQGCRIALVHAGVPANGVSRETWRTLLGELHEAVATLAA